MIPGVIRDESGEPLPDAGISVFPADMASEQIEYMTTNAQGEFHFEYLPISGLRLSVSEASFENKLPDLG
ncbi:MAG TPA: carboxypeptidase-like regulatory domain-containing protein [Planctomycetaceae bacterium]|nr:carboxypeptidase-like regulatory domain-containing protein [Planctomycetaceae bacterium]